MPALKSLPLAQFPRKARLAIERLATPRRGRRRYSKSSIATTINSFGQYLKTVQEAGLPLELSREGLELFIQALEDRPLRNSTRLTYITGVQAMAKELEYPAFERRWILDDCEFYRNAMMSEVPRKVRKLAAHPLTLSDVATAAVTSRKIAQEAASTSRRRTYYQRSAALAFLSIMPLRISDLNNLVLGETIQREEGGWILTLNSGKTGFRHSTPLHHSLTGYLDDLLLFGAAGSQQYEYERRIGTPLFCNEMNEHLSPRTLAYNFKTATGHTPHIVRTLVHDEMAKHGTYGSDLARALCGQTSIQIAKRYEVHAAGYRVEEAQKVLIGIQVKTLAKVAHA
jgi:integrase